MAFGFDVAAIAALALLIGCMAWKNPTAFFPIGSVLLVLVWEGISVLYLERGTYTSELMLETYRTGATLRFVLAIALFVGAYWAAFRAVLNREWMSRLNDRSPRLQSASRVALPMILFALAATLLLAVYVPRHAISLRSQYLIDNPNFLRDKLLAYLPVVTLILGMGCGLARTARIRALGYSTALLILVVLYLFGNKFSEILEAFFLFCVPLVAFIRAYPADRSVFGLKLRQQILIATGTLLVLVSLGIMRQSQHLTVTSADTEGVQYVFDRVFIAEGGIYWYTDNDVVHNASHPGLSEFVEFVRNEHYFKNSSLMYLMSRAIGYDLTYKIFMIDDALFTGAFPSIFYVIGGRFGPFFLCPLTGVIVGLSAAYALRKMLQGQLLLAILAFSVFAPVQSFASGAEFTGFFSLGFASKLFLLMCAETYLLARSLYEGRRLEGAM